MPRRERMKSRLTSKRLAVSCGLLLAFSALGASFAWAQSATARIEGVVTDESGAAVPGASATATNLATNVAKTVTTDADGGYVLTPLAVGRYRVALELQGFKPTSTTITLTVNQVARFDVTLSLGTISEAIEVSGAAPMMEMSTSSVGTIID